MRKPSGWRPSNEQKLGDALGLMIDAYGLREKLDELDIASWWDEVAGGLIARHTVGITLKRGHMHVRVDNAPLRHELGFMKERLIELLNERSGRVVVRSVSIG